MANRKRVMIVLANDEFGALEKLADKEERTAPQQATFIIRQMLAREGAETSARG